MELQSLITSHLCKFESFPHEMVKSEIKALSHKQLRGRDVLPRRNAVIKNYHSAPVSQSLWHLSLLPPFCTHFCSMTKSCSSTMSVIQPPLITLAGMGVPYPPSPVTHFLTVLSLPLPSCSPCSTWQPVTLLRHKAELLTPLLKNPPWLPI